MVEVQVQINYMNELKYESKKGDPLVEGVHYKLIKSHASCKIKEIKGLIFGGISSRFWMLRKHVNLMDYRIL